MNRTQHNPSSKMKFRNSKMEWRWREVECHQRRSMNHYKRTGAFHCSDYFLLTYDADLVYAVCVSTLLDYNLNINLITMSEMLLYIFIPMFVIVLLTYFFFKFSCSYCQYQKNYVLFLYCIYVSFDCL